MTYGTGLHLKKRIIKWLRQKSGKRLYKCFNSALQRKFYLCTVLPEIKLRGLSPNFHIHVSVNDLYIPAIVPPIFLQQKIGKPIAEKYKSLRETWILELGLRPRSFVSGNICFRFSLDKFLQFKCKILSIGIRTWKNNMKWWPIPWKSSATACRYRQRPTCHTEKKDYKAMSPKVKHSSRWVYFGHMYIVHLSGRPSSRLLFGR